MLNESKRYAIDFGPAASESVHLLTEKILSFLFMQVRDKFWLMELLKEIKVANTLVPIP